MHIFLSLFFFFFTSSTMKSFCSLVKCVRCFLMHTIFFNTLTSFIVRRNVCVWWRYFAFKAPECHQYKTCYTQLVFLTKATKKTDFVFISFGIYSAEDRRWENIVHKAHRVVTNAVRTSKWNGASGLRCSVFAFTRRVKVVHTLTMTTTTTLERIWSKQGRNWTIFGWCFSFFFFVLLSSLCIIIYLLCIVRSLSVR